MDLGESQVRTWNDVLAAFDDTKVFWLVTLLIIEFITGVAIALRDNKFDWNRTLDIAKKSVLMIVAWGAAFIYSADAGTAVYALIVATVSGGVAQNVVSLLGIELNGVVGQLLSKGPGDSTVKPE